MADRGIEQAYDQAGFGRPGTPGARPAILVVDFSCGFADPSYPIGTDLSSRIEATTHLIEAGRGRDVPVVFTTIAFEEGLPNTWLTKAPGLGVLREGTPAVELDPRLPRKPHDAVLTKRGASAFFGTGLISLLVALRADTLLVCGATTSGCVRASVVDAVQYGFPTFVVRDAVGDRAQEPHDASLFDMQAKYADVVSLDESLALLT